MKILFVCRRNRFRSLTAEKIFDGVAGHQVRSAGVHGRRIVANGFVPPGEPAT